MMHDTEDREWWYTYGMEKEADFVRHMKSLGNDYVKINPKKEHDVAAPDLLVRDRYLADLKTQNTPFFSAERYGMDAQHTVTFNAKDYTRYASLYPNIQIFFWVIWPKRTWQGWSVEAHHAIYHVSLRGVADRIFGRGEFSPAPYHAYQRREGKEGNAKVSFLFDVRGMNCIWKEAVMA